MDKLAFEKEAWSKGFVNVAGMDEAGRGPLAGPVVAACCYLPRSLVEPGCNGQLTLSFLKEIDDSKKLSSAKRKALFTALKETPGVLYGVGIVSADEIDEINIYQATIKAMKLAFSSIQCPIDYLLIDGMHIECGEATSRKVIKGDALSLSIGAASIIAKETRDELMQQEHARYPAYGFDKHKGYGTKKHLQAICELGPVLGLHRRTFSPINMYV